MAAILATTVNIKLQHHRILRNMSSLFMKVFVIPVINVIINLLRKLILRDIERGNIKVDNIGLTIFCLYVSASESCKIPYFSFIP